MELVYIRSYFLILYVYTIVRTVFVYTELKTIRLYNNSRTGLVAYEPDVCFLLIVK
jgi:hypothetical protein